MCVQRVPEDVSRDVLPNEAIWFQAKQDMEHVYDFQKDALLLLLSIS